MMRIATHVRTYYIVIVVHRMAKEYFLLVSRYER